MRSNFSYLYKKYRMRFWLYTFGPALLGTIFGVQSFLQIKIREVFLLSIFFLVMYNLFIYAVNDYFDFDIDKNNPKKDGYEINDAKNTTEVIGISIFTFISALSLLLLSTDTIFIILISLCLFFGFFYSAPPFRFKEILFLDSLSNVLYTLPAIATYYYYAKSLPPFEIIVLLIAWPAAMHLFSAIIDIDSDKKDGVNTTAVFLGKKKSLRLCFVYWSLVTSIVLFNDYYFLAGLSVVYPLLMIFLLLKPSFSIKKLYTYFPIINGGVGFIVFLYGVFRLV